MKKTMYRVEFHYKDKYSEEFSHCTVEPIYVTREGCLPGCSGVTITAHDMKGNSFNSDPKNYFQTEEEAWDYVRSSIRDSIALAEKTIKELQEGIERDKAYLLSLQENE